MGRLILLVDGVGRPRLYEIDGTQIAPEIVRLEHPQQVHGEAPVMVQFIRQRFELDPDQRLVYRQMAPGMPPIRLDYLRKQPIGQLPRPAPKRPQCNDE